MDTYFVNVGRTSVDCRVVVDMRLADAYDKLGVQHSHSLVAHMVALTVDSYSAVDNLGLE